VITDQLLIHFEVDFSMITAVTKVRIQFIMTSKAILAKFISTKAILAKFISSIQTLSMANLYFVSYLVNDSSLRINNDLF